MADKRSEVVGSFSDGAERLERLIRGVKDRQYTQAHTAPEPKSVSNAFAVSPEETWSKKYMTAGIGPNEFKPVQMPSIPVAVPTASQPLKPAPMTLEPAMEVQAKPTPRPAAQARPAPAARPVAPEVRPGPIGQAIAKPQRKRSWFGRLVRGG